jgi:uncharacterized protein YjbI with pentapeptide repeats
MLQKITSRHDSSIVLFECEVSDGIDVRARMRHALEKACQEGADLAHANLEGANLARANLAHANLEGAYLAGANLARANLAGAYLAGANLAGANLARAYLEGAYLAGANLARANLAHANLEGANLAGANLARANLAHANLEGAYLEGADLAHANLAHANLEGADLEGANGADLAIAKTRILPDGDLIGWKKCNGGVIAKLRIPSDAKRSHAFGRKCRAEFADVLEVFGAEFGVTDAHGPRTEYRVGQRVRPDKFSDNWQDECSNGIHFFITRLEAENY